MPHFSLNLIYVGWENFTDDDTSLMMDVVSASRNTFWQVGFDLFQVFAYSIPVADAQGYAVIDQNVEASFLTSEWTIPNDGIDVFLVKEYVGAAAGLSPVYGTCDKYAGWPSMSGVVVELVGEATKIAFPHEIAHYLGLDHVSDPTNLMYGTTSNGGRLTFGQGVEMAAHCFVRFP